MKLVEGIEATKNVMVLEEVKGGTLDSYLKDTSSEAISIADKAKADMNNQSPDKQSQIATKAAQNLQTLYMDMQEKYKSTMVMYIKVISWLIMDGKKHRMAILFQNQI